MMAEKEIAAVPTAIGTSGGTSKAVEAFGYHNAPFHGNVEYPARVVAERFNLALPTAREICRMAGIGGAA